MKPIPIMVALKLKQYYPNNIALTAIKDEEINRFSAIASTHHEGEDGVTLYDMNDFKYHTGIEAIYALEFIIKNMMEGPILTISN